MTFCSFFPFLLFSAFLLDFCSFLARTGGDSAQSRNRGFPLKRETLRRAVSEGLYTGRRLCAEVWPAMHGGMHLCASVHHCASTEGCTSARRYGRHARTEGSTSAQSGSPAVLEEATPMRRVALPLC